jgi:hypothetical protein
MAFATSIDRLSMLRYTFSDGIRAGTYLAPACECSFVKAMTDQKGWPRQI